MFFGTQLVAIEGFERAMPPESDAPPFSGCVVSVHTPKEVALPMAKMMRDVGDEATRQMIHDCFLYYFDGVKGAQFVSEVLDKRHAWKHLLMSRRMLSNVLQDDDTTMTGHIDKLTKKVDKLAEVMGRQQ